VTAGLLDENDAEANSPAKAAAAASGDELGSPRGDRRKREQAEKLEYQGTLLDIPPRFPGMPPPWAYRALQPPFNYPYGGTNQREQQQAEGDEVAGGCAGQGRRSVAARAEAGVGRRSGGAAVNFDTITTAYGENVKIRSERAFSDCILDRGIECRRQLFTEELHMLIGSVLDKKADGQSFEYCKEWYKVGRDWVISDSSCPSFQTIWYKFHFAPGSEGILCYEGKEVLAFGQYYDRAVQELRSFEDALRNFPRWMDDRFYTRAAHISDFFYPDGAGHIS